MEGPDKPVLRLVRKPADKKTSKRWMAELKPTNKAWVVHAIEVPSDHSEVRIRFHVDYPKDERKELLFRLRERSNIANVESSTYRGDKRIDAGETLKGRVTAEDFHQILHNALEKHLEELDQLRYDTLAEGTGTNGKLTKSAERTLGEIEEDIANGEELRAKLKDGTVKKTDPTSTLKLWRPLLHMPLKAGTVDKLAALIKDKLDIEYD